MALTPSPNWQRSRRSSHHAWVRACLHHFIFVTVKSILNLTLRNHTALMQFFDSAVTIIFLMGLISGKSTWCHLMFRCCNSKVKSKILVMCKGNMSRMGSKAKLCTPFVFFDKNQKNIKFFWPSVFQILTSWTIKRCQMWPFWWRGSLFTPTKSCSSQPLTGNCTHWLTKCTSTRSMDIQ